MFFHEMTVILNPNSMEQLELACYHLQRGEPVGVPSETVYGLAALFDKEEALAQVFRIKNRPDFDPLIVHVADDFDLAVLVREKFFTQQKLIEKFWPGPLTILFEKNQVVPDLCTAGSSMVALRSPNHPVFQKLLKKIGKPLAAPSANRFGRISPTSAEDVVEELGPFGLAAVLNGGPCEFGVESTVIKLHSENDLEILRQGAITVEALKLFLGSEVNITISENGSGIDPKKIEAPGQLKSHYAPKTPLKIVSSTLTAPSKETALIVCDKKNLATALPSAENIFYLTETSSDLEAAACLFATLRRVDKKGFDRIDVVLGNEQGLFRAVNERLRKAAN